MSTSEAVQRVRVVGLSVAEEASIRISQVKALILEMMGEGDVEKRARLAMEARLELERIRGLLERLRELEDRERICATMCAPRWPPTAAPTAFSEV